MDAFIETLRWSSVALFALASYTGVYFLLSRQSASGPTAVASRAFYAGSGLTWNVAVLADVIMFAALWSETTVLGAALAGLFSLGVICNAWLLLDNRSFSVRPPITDARHVLGLTTFTLGLLWFAVVMLIMITERGLGPNQLLALLFTGVSLSLPGFILGAMNSALASTTAALDEPGNEGFEDSERGNS